jgi:hypothetical protein
MMDYEKQLNFYYEDESREQTASYFEKYWLDRKEYIDKWLPIQNTIYDGAGNVFPDVKFKSEFEIIALRGGLIFTEEGFALLQQCMLQIGDSHFVIVENANEYEPHHGEPILRFKYPANITWDELTSGGYVSLELFQIPVKEYFVFGDTGTWGKYVANDYVYPLDIIGFQKEYAEVFREHFEPLIELEVYTKWLPNAYK